LPDFNEIIHISTISVFNAKILESSTTELRRVEINDLSSSSLAAEIGVYSFFKFVENKSAMLAGLVRPSTEGVLFLTLNF